MFLEVPNADAGRAILASLPSGFAGFTARGMNRHPLLREALKQDADWLVLLDETGAAAKRDPRCRLFIALRKKPNWK